jgi:hypothetical protein
MTSQGVRLSFSFLMTSSKKAWCFSSLSFRYWFTDRLRECRETVVQSVRGDALKILSTVPEITFDDVLLLTGRCEYTIAEETLRADVRAKLSRNIALEVPLVSAPMPGVSGPDMVVALSECGSLGILHAFRSFRSQLEDAVAAKQKGARVGAAIYEHSEASFAHARQLVQER